MVDSRHLNLYHSGHVHLSSRSNKCWVPFKVECRNFPFENSDFLPPVPPVPWTTTLNVNEKMAECEKFIFVWQVCEYLKRQCFSSISQWNTRGKTKDNMTEAWHVFILHIWNCLKVSQSEFWLQQPFHSTRSSRRSENVCITNCLEHSTITLLMATFHLGEESLRLSSPLCVYTRCMSSAPV